MAKRTKAQSYKIAKILHWIAFVFIVFNLLSGWRLDNFERDIKIVLMMVHSSVGTTIFILMLVRWWWRKSNRLYEPPRWWKRPTMVLQWVFYPLVVTQVLIGVAQAAFADIPILGFGFIPYSSLAADNPATSKMFLTMHQWMAWLLITLTIIHGVDRGRTAFIDEAPVAGPA